MKQIQMVDLYRQHQPIQAEIEESIQKVIQSATFINGSQVKEFVEKLASFLNIKFIIPCGNGTDALQIALMSLNLEEGDEILLPAFNYVAAAEVILLLKLKPVFVDVDLDTFNICTAAIEEKISTRTKVLIPTHLFGQMADMDAIMNLAAKYKLFVLEDAAQSLGATYTFPSGKRVYAGTVGDIGITSFFPSKNLGCMGDGGAIFTNNPEIAERASQIANHGQKIKYVYNRIGINSRLDSIQAAVLNVKLSYFGSYLEGRKRAGQQYMELLSAGNLILPVLAGNRVHVFNQFTVKVDAAIRDELRAFLAKKGVPSMVYYPSPLHYHAPYKKYFSGSLVNSEKLCSQVLSLPIYPEIDAGLQEYIAAILLQGLNELAF